MADDIFMDKFIFDILPIANTQSGPDESSPQFSGIISDMFGIDKVEIHSAKKIEGSSSSLLGYVINTRKPYIDNQLSEYSAFPEMILQRNNGYSSCAAIPIIASGKVIGVLEMLSKVQGKFTEDLIKKLTLGLTIMGFSLAYKSEAARSVKLASYFDSSFGAPMPQFIISSEGSIIKFNKEALLHFAKVQTGSKFDEAIGASFKEIVNSSEKRNPVKVNIPVNNEIRNFEVKVSKVSSTAFHMAFTDRTALNKFEKIMALVNESPDVCIMFSDKNLYIKEIVGTFGKLPVSMNELMSGQNLLNFSAQDKFLESLKKVLEKGAQETSFGELNLLLLNGLQIHVHYSITRINDGYVILVVDSDNEKLVENAKSNLDDFVNATSDPVISVDNLGYIKKVNLSAERILGYNREELNGKEIKSIYKENEILDRDIAYVRNGGKIDGTYVNLIKKDQSLMPAVHSIRSINESGNADYIILLKELETKQMIERQEEYLRALDTRIKRSESVGQLKSQFISDIAHELKTPLTNIMGFTKLLYDGEFGEIPEEQKEYLKTILDESDRLMFIIMQVLDAAKLDARRVKLDLTEISMTELYNNPSIRALEESATNKGLAFDWIVSYDTPIVQADLSRIIQVFTNLIGNAIKFTEKGGIKVNIYKKSRNTIACEVIDTGIGIGEEDKRKIFRKFYQASKKNLTIQNGAGTGLGLAITKEIVSLHHGKIKFESELGKGSKFWFTIPIKQNPNRKARPQE